MIPKTKIAADSAWSYGAYAVMAASGLLLNLVIGDVFGASGLGVFTQVMAVFVITSHLSVLGLHNAVFRGIALVPADASAILASAAAAALPFAIAAALLVILCAQPIGFLLDSPATGRAIVWTAPGILFFGINKIGLAALNALTLMRRHALGQMLRYLAIAGVVVAVALTDETPERLGAAFTIAELLVTLYLLAATAPVLAGGRRRPSPERIAGLVFFGLRSAAAGLLTELNLRVDVLMLGLFLPDRDVGIYAFAALLIEGLANIALVLRNLINPYLTRMLAARDDAGLRLLVRMVLLGALPAAMLALAGTWLFYQPAIRLLLGPGDLELALAPLLILIAMMAPYFGYSAFEDSLMLAGRAGTQSLYQLAVTAGNATLNFALIPIWGIEGAATATGLASLLACLALITILRRATGLSLLPWPAGMRLSAAGKD